MIKKLSNSLTKFKIVPATWIETCPNTLCANMAWFRNYIDFNIELRKVYLFKRYKTSTSIKLLNLLQSGQDDMLEIMQNYFMLTLIV